MNKYAQQIKMSMLQEPSAEHLEKLQSSFQTPIPPSRMKSAMWEMWMKPDYYFSLPFHLQACTLW